MYRLLSLFRIAVTCILGITLMQHAMAVTATQQGNRLLIDGKPTPLLFARGCQNVAALPAYRALGFNTVLVRIDSLAPVALKDAEQLVSAAERQGMYALIELATGAWCAGQRANVFDAKYVENASDYLEQVTPLFHDHDNVVGVIIATVQEGQLVSDNNASFAEFLQEKYGAIENLNAAWSTKNTTNGDSTASSSSNFPSFTLIGALPDAHLMQLAGNEVVRKLIRADQAEYREILLESDADFRRYLQTRFQTLYDLNVSWQTRYTDWEKVTIASIRRQEQDRSGSVPLGILEIARYQATSPRLALEWWAAQLRKRDPGHLLFAGGQTSYRTIACLPPSLNGVFTECYPAITEPDTESHNPHAIDIARRGNRFIVLAGVQAWNTDPQHFVHYLYEMSLHGAAGIGVADWPTLINLPEHSALTRVALADIKQRGLLNRTPAPRAAIVYSPYPIGPPLSQRALYGYLPDFFSFGPGSLIFALRQGTCYGQIDYLAPEDVAAAPLMRYSAILMPSTLDLPEIAQQAVGQFVQAGGTVLADIGLGTFQANGNMHSIPPMMSQLFGVRVMPGVKNVRYNLEVYRLNPRFPSLIQSLKTTGIGGGFTVIKAAKAIPLPRTDLLFQLVGAPRNSLLNLHNDQPKERPKPRPMRLLKMEPMYGFFILKNGDGYALFAPFPLYQLWVPRCMLFEEFHRDFFGMGADVMLRRPIDFLPAFAEVATYADGSVALWTKDQSSPVADLRNPQRQAYLLGSGQCDIGPELTTLRGDQPGFHVATPLSIWLSAVDFTINFAATAVNDQRLEFDLGADDDHAGRPITLRIGGGDYPIAPKSSHLVTVTTRAGQQAEVMQADNNGQLVVSSPASRCHLVITRTDTQVEVQPATTQPRQDSDGIINAIPTLP